MTRSNHMKSLACKDMGVSECNFVAKADTAEEVIKKASEHAMRVHADKIREMSQSMSEEEMKQAMMAAVKEA